MNIQELMIKIKKTINVIRITDNSSDAQTIVENLNRLYSFLGTSDESQSYKTLFGNKEFELLLRSLFPSAPIGLGNYYNSQYSDNQKDIVYSTQSLLSKIEDENFRNKEDAWFLK